MSSILLNGHLYDIPYGPVQVLNKLCNVNITLTHLIFLKTIS